ncbi:hypothetical protein BCF46_3617 [Litoreibacter meonggei]|uniref:Uncharacterized protein n=1 Tax=Litoreibacter meonggei TaxID=1049199 RepID=A0A497VBT7_9RHOB|nr:hypothetical protein BCF46_3617 [Litoreibacter meonggei]
MYLSFLFSLVRSSVRLRPKSELEAVVILLLFVVRHWRAR